MACLPEQMKAKRMICRALVLDNSFWRQSAQKLNETTTLLLVAENLSFFLFFSFGARMKSLPTRSSGQCKSHSNHSKLLTVGKWLHQSAAPVVNEFSGHDSDTFSQLLETR
mmetsp:Transcript_20416/g.42859  ORF Transcript_20416/g.42859 Transcript_20416/m.42859 type:complete len:111 (-) Transcript_20416:160-492(-)